MSAADSKLGVAAKLQSIGAGDDSRLKDACQGFEAMLLNQMMKEMRATIPKNDLFGSKETEDMFQGMLDDEMMKDASQSSSLGLAEVLYDQLATRNIAKVSLSTVDTLNGRK